MTLIELCFVALVGLSCASPTTTMHQREIANVSPRASEEASCQIEDLAMQIRLQQQVVPSRIYRWGEKKNQISNAVANTVPQKIWDHFVLGKGGRYSLKPFRRGLYGSSSPEDADLFSDYWDLERAWLVEVEIAPECREPHAVATLVALFKDERFLHWFQSASYLPFPTLDSFVATCFVVEGAKNEIPNGTMVGGAGEADSSCEVVYERFFNETAVKIVQDHQVRRSWYLRDRSCIRGIRGTPPQIIEILAEREAIWHNHCTQARSGESLMRLLLAALIEMNDSVSSELLRKISLNARDSTIVYSPVNQVVPEIVNAYQRCHDTKRRALFKKKANMILNDFYLYSDDYENNNSSVEQAKKFLKTRKLQSRFGSLCR